MPVPPNTNNPIQSQLGGAGAQNIFIAVINPTLQSPTPPISNWFTRPILADRKLQVSRRN